MHDPTLMLSDEQIDAVLDQRAHFGYVIADKRERMRMFARDILTYANSQQLAPAAQEPGYKSKRLAEMVLSDCGCSSDFTPLLERVAGRIEAHVEQHLSALQTSLQAKQAPAAQGDVAPKFVMGRGYIEGSIGGHAYRDGWDDALTTLRVARTQARQGGAA